jgi:hypothetical protein
MFDPDLPGGFQDADIEMAALTAAGNRAAALASKEFVRTDGYLLRPSVRLNAMNAARYSTMPLTPVRKVITACTDSMTTIAPAGTTRAHRPPPGFIPCQQSNSIDKFVAGN